MNYIKQEGTAFVEDREYQEYLKTFLEEGEAFNGTNIWLGNIKNNKTVFAHNQEDPTNKF